jgi:hypothetical protein
MRNLERLDAGCPGLAALRRPVGTSDRFRANTDNVPSVSCCLDTSITSTSGWIATVWGAENKVQEERDSFAVR